MRISSKVIVASAFVIGLPLLGLVALPFLLDANRYRSLVQEQLQQRLHCPVSLGNMQLKTFPVSIRIADVVVGQPQGFSSPEPLLQAKEVFVGVALLPLLRKEVSIKTVQLRSPRIELIRNTAGKWNYETGSSEGSGGSNSLSLDELRVEDGQVALNDQRAASPRDVYEHIDVALKGLGTNRNGSLAGTVRLDTMAARLNVKADFQTSAELAAKGTLNLESDRSKEPLNVAFDVRRPTPASPVTINSVTAKIGAISAEITGSVNTQTTPAGLLLNVKTAKAPISELTHLARLYGAKFPADLRVDGQLNADLQVTGTTQTPVFAGKLEATKAEISAKDLAEPVRASELRADFTPKLLNTQPFTLETGGTRVTAQVTVSDYAGPGRKLTGTLQTNGAKVEELLRMATAYGVRPSGLNGSGLVTLDLRISQEGNNLSYSGSGALRQISLSSPQLPKTLTVSNGDIKFSNDRIGLENLKAALGRMHVDGACSVRDLSHPDIQFNAHVDEVNLVEVRQWKTGDSAASSKGPDKISANGALTIDRLIDDRTTLSNVKSTVNYGKNILKLDPLTASVFGGQVTGSITADLHNSTAPAYAIQTKLTSVDANKLLSATTSVKDILSGTLSGNVDLRCVVKPAENIAKDLNGEVRFQMGQGNLAGVHILDQISSIGKFLGYTKNGSASTKIVKASGSLNILRGVATTNDLFMDLDGGTLSGAGTIGLMDQTLNLRVTTVLNKDFAAKQAGPVGGLLSTVLANQKGELVVPARVTGTFAQPKFLPDPEQVANMRLKGLLPTAGNPAALTTGIMGLVNGLTGNGASATPGEPPPEGGLLDVIDQFRKKKPEKKP